MATGFTAGTSLGSQYQYTPITFAPLLSLVPQRQEAPAAPAPTGLEATAQMPVPQYMGGQEGPGMEMPQGMPGGGFGNPQTGILDEQGVPLTLGDILGGIVNVGSMMMSPLAFGVQAMMGNMPGTAVKGMMTPVETINPAAITLAEQMGVSVNDAQGLIDAMGLQGVQAATGMADIAESGAAGASDDVGGIGGIGDVSPGSGGASPW
jgi:phage-related minor tail protein